MDKNNLGIDGVGLWWIVSVEKGMAAKRRGRNVQELYNATEIIGEPKITSVLREGHRMEGPLDKTQKKYMVRGKGNLHSVCLLFSSLPFP